MKTPLVHGWRGAAYRSVDFAKYVTAWEDQRDPSGPTHHYNKRDGGEAEPMGRKPHAVTFHLSYVGKTWRADFLQLQAEFDENPVGLVVHPVYGPMVMFWAGTNAKMDLQEALDDYEVSVRFTESQIDTRASTDDAQGPATKQILIADLSTQLTTAAASFPTASTDVAALTAASAIYAAAAVASASSLAADPSLASKLAQIELYTEAAMSAIAGDPLASTLSPTTALTLAEELYDACGQMADAVQAQRVVLVQWTVPMRMHVTNIARIFYGPDGIDREAEILTNNARVIRDPGYIPAGTVLLMAPRTA